jgi:hypothetical protein
MHMLHKSFTNFKNFNVLDSEITSAIHDASGINLCRVLERRIEIRGIAVGCVPVINNIDVVPAIECHPI